MSFLLYMFGFIGIYSKLKNTYKNFCSQRVNFASESYNIKYSMLFNGETFLTFLATNTTSLGNKLNELKASLLIGEPPDIICVVETWFSETSDTNLEGYVLHIRDRESLGGGSGNIFKISNLISWRIRS